MSEPTPSVAKPMSDDRVVEQNGEAVYSVGVTNDGRTVLKLHDRGLTTTLTLSPAAVEQLIKLLAVTIESNPDDRREEATTESH